MTEQPNIVLFYTYLVYPVILSKYKSCQKIVVKKGAAVAQSGYFVANFGYFWAHFGAPRAQFGTPNPSQNTIYGSLSPIVAKKREIQTTLRYKTVPKENKI